MAKRTRATTPFTPDRPGRSRPAGRTGRSGSARPGSTGRWTSATRQGGEPRDGRQGTGSSAVQRDRSRDRLDRADRPDRAERADRTGDRRDRTGDLRDRTGDRRDRTGERRDRTADRRDRTDGTSDRTADRRDRADRPDRAERADRTGDRPERAADRRDRTSDRQARPGRDGDPRDRQRATAPVRRERPGNRSRRSEAERVVPVPALTGPNAFVDLGVPSPVAAVLAARGITEPTPIQSMTIPVALQGRDVLGRARTGSGKTLAFGLPMITRLGGGRGRPKSPRGLILTPTRELAMQVLDALKPLAQAHGLRVQLVMGGGSYDRQIRGLARADIVVATPGRLVDLADRGAVLLDAVSLVVLDEADHMADLGFMPEIEAIMGRLPEQAQGLLFSATLDGDVDRLVTTYLRDPVRNDADPATATVGTMVHHVLVVHPRDKDAVTAELARRPGRMVAFVRTRLAADRLAEQLEAEGVATAALHAGMKQGARTRTLADFRSGRIQVLVATDVAARGIHVDDIDVVLHVDLPQGPKEYLHRSGRTARAGASGTVVSLATLRQQRAARAITAKAGVDPQVTRVRPGDALLDSGSPATEPHPRTARRASARSA